MTTIEAVRTEYDPRGLTTREAEVCDVLLRGLANKEIAYELGIEISTVRIHLAHAFAKTGVAGRVALAMWWRDNRSLSPAEQRSLEQRVAELERRVEAAS